MRNRRIPKGVPDYQKGHIFPVCILQDDLNLAFHHLPVGHSDVLPIELLLHQMMQSTEDPTSYPAPRSCIIQPSKGE